MTSIRFYAACLLAFACTSCGENKSVDSHDPGSLDPQQRSSADAGKSAKIDPRSGEQAAGSGNSNSDAPAPPRDAQFTIVCQPIPGPGNVVRAMQIKEELIKATGMKGWYVTHGQGQSTLYYGYYRSLDDPQYKADRQRIAMFQDQAGNHPFGEALPVAINAPDPTAPPELNLINAKGYWSIQIAAYQGLGRKEAAVEAAREARKLGVEAYYHHGANVSAVCVGTWPKEAIRQQEYDGGGGIDVKDQDRPILVLGPGAEIPPQIKEQYAKNLIDKNTGRQVQVLEQKVDIVDPTMRATLAKYPVHVLNGEEQIKQVRDPATGKMFQVPTPSMPVPIPHTASVLQSDPMDRPSLLSPAAPVRDGGGRLRSMGQ